MSRKPDDLAGQVAPLVAEEEYTEANDQLPKRNLVSEDDTGMATMSCLPFGCESEKVARVVREDRAPLRHGMFKLEFIRSAQIAGIAGSLAINAMLEKDPGEGDGHGLVQIEFHPTDAGNVLGASRLRLGWG